MPNPLEEFVDVVEAAGGLTNPLAVHSLFRWLIHTDGVNPLSDAAIKELLAMLRGVKTGLVKEVAPGDIAIMLDALVSAIQVILGFNMAFQGVKLMASNAEVHEELHGKGSSATTTPPPGVTKGPGV